MKKSLFALLLTCSFMAHAQVYNNEWIDYTKTYYKFKIGKTGLYRIPQTTLAAAGLSNGAAQDFQLWRNGAQIPVYTSAASGTLSASDYIEFWGEMNNGKPDKALYRNADYQLNDKWSLETDTATYFLTLNPGGNNWRLVTTPNNVSGNTLSPEPYFNYTVGNYFHDKINPGYAVNIGEYIYSASYDQGEGWTSADIANGGVNAGTFSNLFTYTGGGSAYFKIALSGNAPNPRNYSVTINSNAIVSSAVDFFTYRRDSVPVAVSALSSGTANIQVINNSTSANDRMVVHQYELTYPRQFNFGGASNFEFTLPANAAGNYLQISGFNFGTTAPVLYDITNGKRYVADISAAPIVKIALQPSASARRLVLVNEESANINRITGLQTRNFVNYTAANNQGDYLIISNPLLFNGSNGTNPIEDYRAYRSSAAGGSYNAKTCLVDEIMDQFAFGIKKNPLGIRNFINYAQTRFAVAPKHIFLIGKGVNYVDQRYNEASPDADKLNLVPTFGWPASDALFTAPSGSSVPRLSIGRLSAISAQEVALYLKKIKDYEQMQKVSSPLIRDEAWTKNVVHIVGSNDPTLQSTLDGYMNSYRTIISDTLFGANVTTFSKTSADEVQQLSSTLLENLFNQGISLITYFGHSSSSTLSYNLNNPENYNNPGKYPLFIALGCDAGSYYDFNTARYNIKGTVSESWVLAQDRGTIGFIASTYLGIVNYLDIFNSRMYNDFSTIDYGKSVGETIVKATKQTLDFTTEEDFYARSTCEEIALNGDPAVILNAHAKPDYVIEDSLVQITPSFVSVADGTIQVNARFLNVGKAVNQHIVVQVTRQYPNQTSEVVLRDTIPGIRYIDSISVKLPVNEPKDKGANKLIITVDADNQVDELFENNNSITKEFFVYENEAKQIYPYNYAIVSKQNIKLIASSANAFAGINQYKMELDTTELFNSSFKTTGSITSGGGDLEFDPGTSFKDSTVYYWRTGVANATGQIIWSAPFSFIYLNNHASGVNQSHTYQYLESTNNGLYIDTASGKFYYNTYANDLLIRNAIFPTAATADPDFQIAIGGIAVIGGGCSYNSLIFNVFDPVTFNIWQNNYSGGGGLYNSLRSVCGARRQYNFEYSLGTRQDRKKAMDFMDMIPAGSYVVVRANVNPNSNGNTYSTIWRSDTAAFGPGNSLYNKLLQQGFTAIDSFSFARTFTFVFKKDQPGSFAPKMQFSKGIYDKIGLSVTMNTRGAYATITSPLFGPAKAWKQFLWNGYSIDTARGDDAKVDIIGVGQDSSRTVLFPGITINQKNIDISSVDPKQYPYLQLRMINKDSVFHTPYQLKNWQLTYDPVPEGAVAPNLYLSMKDTVDVGEHIDFKVAFKNISDVPFDSLKVKLTLTNNNNVTTTIQQKKYKPLIAGDTLLVSASINTQALTKANSLYVEVNPDNDQPEQYHFNNFGYKNFYVKGDNTSPLLDVTFDNTHILNHDIVSAKPDILIKLKDESKYLLLDDTSLVTVQVLYPDGSIKAFGFNNDTLQFIPAQQGSNNTATVHFKPNFTQDGDYQLIVTGKDKSNNQAGTIQYRVDFQIINKAMISNMLNYPNPFTTATAFVFTVTGSEVPQNIRIQILTVTGKIVRDITKEELGPLHIGRNITEYRWDGTDQYGQKLANGIYLYRVITNLNGKSLDKYTSDSDNTDKYFNKGYGKMYLMR